MFRWIIGSSLQFRFLVVGLAAALVAFGVLQLNKMPLDVFPEFEPPIVEIQTEAIGLSAEEVASLVTLNLEELLSAVPWLDSIRSKSVTGLSSIVLTFDRGTDLILARQMIQERLTLAYTLPNVAQPPTILQPVSSTRRFMMVGISSEKVAPTELSLLARWTIKPRLLGVPGVANVAIWGQRLKQIQVQLDPSRLRDARLMQADIISSAGDALWVSPLTFLKASAPGTGGWIDNANQRLGIHHQMPISTPEDIAKVALTPRHLLMTGKTMSLGDVTEVTVGHPPLIGDGFVNNGNGLMLVVEKLPSANTLEVTKGVEKALAELSLGLPGVKIDASIFRLASYIEDSISNLTQALLIGGILVIFIVGAFLSNWRTMLISAVTIPLSLLAAIVVLNMTCATINTMIIAGLIIALAIVIDDSIIDLEKIMARLRDRKEGEGDSIGTILYQTVLETRSVTTYATLIVVLAVMPIFFMGGLSGAFFSPLAQFYLLATVASLVVGLTVTPALGLMLLGKNSPEAPTAILFRNSFEGFLQSAVKSPRTVFVGAIIVMVGGVVAWPFLGQSLLPPLKERTLLVNWATPPGTSYKETNRITSRVSRELQTLPGVRNVGAHIGRAVTGDRIVGINSSQIWVSIDPKANYDDMVAKVRETINGYPGVDRNLQTYLRNTVSEVLTGSNTPVVVRIYGQRREILNKIAEEVRQALSNIEGLVDLRAEGQVEKPQVEVNVSLDKAGKASVKPGDVRRSAATVFSGLTVGFLFEEQKIYDVTVWSPPEARQSLTDLRDLWVEKTDRHHVRLGDVADVSIVSTPTVIRHEAIAPYVDVVANVAGRDLRSVHQDIENRLQKVVFPLEYHPEILGEYAERIDAQKGIFGVTVASTIGIFLLLQACFRSWRLAVVVFLTLPAAMIGGVLATLASGGVIYLGSIVGFLAVLGMASRNGITLVNHFQRLEEKEEMAFGLDLILRGTREHLPSTLASSLAIIAALLPIIFMGQVPGLEIVQSTAIVIIGGLIASTLFTLFVVPALYLVYGAGAGDREPDLDIAGA